MISLASTERMDGDGGGCMCKMKLRSMSTAIQAGKDQEGSNEDGEKINVF